MSKEINQIGIKGRIANIVERGRGETNGRSWVRTEVTVENVPNAGQKKDENGVLAFTSFQPELKVGQLIGQVCRANGWVNEKNDGKGNVVKYVNVKLSAVGKATVIQDVKTEAPASAPAASESSSEEAEGWGWDS